MKSFREKRAERKAAKRERYARTELFRDWLEARREAAKERAANERIDRNSKPRGVDRVPERLRNIGLPDPEVIHENTDDNYATRRRSAVKFRTRDNMGKVEKVRVRPGDNVPYYSPKRDA